MSRRSEIAPGRMAAGAVAALLVASVCGGCAGTGLTPSTVGSAATLTEVEYRIVMTNIARFANDPATLPAQVRITDGTVQVNDEFGVESLSLAGGGGRWAVGGPRALRTVSGQWSADAITDPVILNQLQGVYRAAFGLRPLPDPPFLDALAGPTATTRRSTSDDRKRRPVRLDLDRDVPRGWFGVGTRRDVPDDARYVARDRDTFVWVRPDHLADFSRFTLAVLFLVQAKTGDARVGPGGLMYTAGGR